MHWESQFYCKRIKEFRIVSRCLQQRRQSWHFCQWSRRLLSQCSQVLTSFWNDPTWPNYPLRLPLATLQLVRLKTSPASKVTSNRCLTWTNTQLSCRSCTCNLVICISQAASMTLPASWHALQSFSVVLGSPVRIAAKQLYLHRCRRYKRTKSVSRNSKNRRISISSISVCISGKILVYIGIASGRKKRWSHSGTGLKQSWNLRNFCAQLRAFLAIECDGH